MQRVVERELLDELPPEDPRAVRSRRDLRRVNVLMRNHVFLADGLTLAANGHRPDHILDLGAGDGDFLLRVARRLRSWDGARVSLIDRRGLAAPETLKGFEALGWRADQLVSDVFAWARSPDARSADPANVVVVANLFLHHFSNTQLVELLRVISDRSRLFVAVEPRRAAWPLWCSRSLWTVGCNSVTRHDAVASVRAGFTKQELSSLWPAAGEWTLTEKPAGLFSHFFLAQRRS